MNKEKFLKAKEKLSLFMDNKKALFAVFSIIWIVVISITLTNMSSSLGMYSKGNRYFYDEDPVIELTKDTTVVQEIETKSNSKSIVFNFATYQRKNSGKINIEVTGIESGKKLLNKNINVKSVQDNAFVAFSLGKDFNYKVDEHVKVTITSTCEKGKSVGIKTTSIKSLQDGKLKVNNEEYENDLLMRYMVVDKDMSSFCKLFIIISVIAISLIMVLMFIFDIKYEQIFALIALLLGIVFMFIITPYSVPDEYVHYGNANQFASKIEYGDKDKIDAIYFIDDTFIVQDNSKEFYKTFAEKWNKPLTSTDVLAELRVDIDDQYTIPYIPQALGLILGRELKLPMIQTLYLGRFFNLLFYCACLYFSIKITPVHKTLFGIIGTLPIFLQQCSSYSYDCFSNSLSFLIVAFLFKWMCENEKVKIVDYLIVLFIMAIIAPFKYIYGLLSVLFILVPYDRYPNKISKWILTLGLCTPMLIQLVPILLPRIITVFGGIFVSKVSADTIDYTGIDAIQTMRTYDLDYISSHFVETIKFIIISIRYSLKTWYYGSIGRYLSGLCITLPLRLTHVVSIVLVAASLLKQKFTYSLKAKALMISISVLMGLFTIGGMLIYWTVIGAPFIQGVQGRYFSSLLPLVFAFFANSKVFISEKFEKPLISIHMMTLFITIVYVLSYTCMN